MAVLGSVKDSKGANTALITCPALSVPAPSGKSVRLPNNTER